MTEAYHGSGSEIPLMLCPPPQKSRPRGLNTWSNTQELNWRRTVCSSQRNQCRVSVLREVLRVGAPCRQQLLRARHRSLRKLRISYFIPLCGEDDFSNGRGYARFCSVPPCSLSLRIGELEAVH